MPDPRPDPDDMIYSRVTVIDAGTLYVASSQGDFPTTVLEEMVGREHVPGWTHNPPMVIVLEADLNKRGEGQDPLEPTPLARACNAALHAELERLAALHEQQQEQEEPHA